MNSTDPVEVVAGPPAVASNDEAPAAVPAEPPTASPATSPAASALSTPVAEPRELSPHPQLLRVWTVGALVFVVPAALIASTILGAAGHRMLVPGALTIAAGVIWVVRAYGHAWLSRFRCRLLDDGLWVDRGVWWRSETFVPRTRVQHTEVQQGPIARQFGIASLKVFTAGAGHGEIEIDGLTHADALWLRDALLGRQGQDGV